ncbi:MAG: aldehyde dehydrogenase family protein [Deltaproteobacteria bacterium]|nr:aldehyde dehydrogenase family protein [Deltaproteobacteria bacterium]MCB9787294.1 aldehyde dehydrogenase family protein [Deltaproteobacteria bacterium]
MTAGPTPPAAAPAPLSLSAIRAAQRAWAAEPLESRCAHLREIGRRFAARADDVARVVCEETRKHPADAWFADVVPNLDLFTWWTGPGRKPLLPKKLPLSSLAHPGKRAVLHTEPRGVVGLITPWNYPAAIPLRTLVPALLAGNAVLFKPSEVTPRTGALLAEIFSSVLPSGVLTLVQGAREAGEQVVDLSDHVVFTGSVATGRRVGERCASQLKSVSLELGGKDAAIVLRDCDLERTVDGVLWGAVTNSGQNCAAIERVYVEAAIYDRFVGRLLARAEGLQVAPVATEAQDRIVREHLAEAESLGATLHGEYPGGAVILTDVPEGARILVDETFGPVCPVVRVDDGDAALRLANASEFGLTLSIWTRSEARAQELAARARAGVVTINNVALTASMPFAPWSGRGASGHGATNSEWALREMTQPKVVLVDDNRAPEPWWLPADDAAVRLARLSLEWLRASGPARLAATLRVVRGLKARTRQQAGRSGTG